VTALDSTAFYGSPGELVNAIAPHTEADPAALLLDFLTCFGSAVGPGPHVRVGGATHRARLFVVIVGATSRARKGQSRSEIRPIFEAADPCWSSTRVVGGLASGEGLIAAVRDDDDDPERSVCDKRLLVIEEEFSRVLKAAGREGSTLSEIVRQAFDRDTLSILTRRDPLTARGAHISIIAHVTAEELRHRLNDLEVANGFANRFIIARVQRSRLLPHGATTSLANSLCSQVRHALDAARRIGEVKRSPAADLVWEMIYEALETRDDDGLVGAVTARSSAHVLRLSLVYALTDGSRTIEPEHVIAAYEVWRYADASVRALWPTSIGNHLADRIVEIVTAAGEDGRTRTELSAGLGRHATKSEIDEAVRLLADRRLVVEVPQLSSGGRSAVRYFLCETSESAKEPCLPSLDSLLSHRDGQPL
jgi:hypothetical protein